MQEYESEILKQLEQARIQMVVLAGFMRIIGPTLLKVWEGRMINLHPSLLPQLFFLRRLHRHVLFLEQPKLETIEELLQQ